MDMGNFRNHFFNLSRRATQPAIADVTALARAGAVASDNLIVGLLDVDGNRLIRATGVAGATSGFDFRGSIGAQPLLIPWADSGTAGMILRTLGVAQSIILQDGAASAQIAAFALAGITFSVPITFSSITYAGDFTMDLTGAGPRTFFLIDSTALQVANFDVDGQIIYRNGHATGTFTFSGTPTGARVITFQDASGTVPYLGSVQTFTAAQTFTAVPVVQVDAAAGVTDVLSVAKTNSGGAGAASDGARILFRGETATANVLESTGGVASIITTATAGALISDLALYSVTASVLTERWRILGSGNLVPSTASLNVGSTVTPLGTVYLSAEVLGTGDLTPTPVGGTLRGPNAVDPTGDIAGVSTTYQTGNGVGAGALTGTHIFQVPIQQAINGVPQTQGTVLEASAAGTTATVSVNANNDVQTSFIDKRTSFAGTGANGVGVRHTFTAPSTTSVQRLVASIEAVLTTATNAAEVGVMDLFATIAGAALKVLRLGSVANAVNSFLMTARETTVNPKLSVAGDGNLGVDIVPTGTGSTRVRNAADAATVFGIENVSAGVWGLALENQSVANQTCNAISGQFRIGNGTGAAGVAISNSRVKAGATVLLTPRNIDATAISFAVTTVAGGSFTVTTTANATANMDFFFLVINPPV